MQLHFTKEEMALLADVLDERDTGLRKQIAQAESGPAQQVLERKRAMGNALLDKVIGRQLQLAVDELENLCDILAEINDDLRTRIAQADNGSASKRQLEQKKSLLQSVRDKATEACAMA